MMERVPLQEAAVGQTITMYEDRDEFGESVGKDLAVDNALDMAVGPGDDREELREVAEKVVGETWAELEDSQQ